MKSGKVNRKSWIEKERNIDVFDIKSDVVKTLIELGVSEKDLFINDKQNSVTTQEDLGL